MPRRAFHTVLRSPAFSISATADYTHLIALKRHYAYAQTVQSVDFLNTHDRFLAWSEPDQKWFEWRVQADPRYRVTWLGSDQGNWDKLDLYLVEKTRP